jgi:hypothetical protein
MAAGVAKYTDFAKERKSYPALIVLVLYLITNTAY